jgi:hypothetical protein
MAATTLIGAGANLALLNNAGNSALRIAERLLLRAAGAEPVAPALRNEHKTIVALLKGHGAT